MPQILGRLYRLAKSELQGRLNAKKPKPAGKNPRPGPDQTEPASPKRPAAPAADLPAQVIEDLAVFNLSPPASLEMVRRARNQEIKKYHSDHFLNDPEKYQVSKEIMQIYNAAYERLKTFYSNKASP